MRGTETNTIGDYIASQPPAVQTVLRRVRSLIRKAMPEAEECISYRMPAYRLHGRVVLYFAGWTEHYSLYPATGGLVEALGDAIKPHVVSKGTIRFALSEPVPAKLIEQIAKFRVQEAEERRAVKAASPKKRKARAS